MKVLLVDDNYQMLEFMFHCIPWTDKGLDVIGLCENGVEALEIAKKNTPDIIITDIDMPHMNGLQLLEQLEHLNPNMESLIISCHDDFHYAKKALKLLVNDYILKETIEPETLLEAINRIMEKIREKNKQQNDMNQWKSIVDQNQLSLKKQWLRTLEDSPIIQDKVWIARSKKFNIDLETKKYIPVIGYVQNSNSSLEQFKTADLVMYSIDNIAQEMNMDGFIYDDFQILWFFPTSNGIKENTYDDIRTSMSKLQATLEQYYGIKIAFIYSKPVKTICEFQQTVREMVHIEHEWFYIDDNSIFALDNITSSFSTDNIFIHSATVVEELKRLVYEGCESTIEHTVNKWIDLLKETKYHPDKIKCWVNNILVTISLSHHVVINHKNQPIDLLHSDIHSIVNIQQLREYMCQFIRAVIQYVEAEGKSERPEIWEAKKYVEKHINERITMEAVAQHLFLNPSHFSRIFRKETDETFIEYVTRLKMKKAVEFLTNTSDTIEDISNKLGYENTSYFIKLFKKTNQLSPLEYRKAN
ncbi:response regulator [Paenalkalicoccus suaedae]|uniref:Response regulator n=1 Tax=Paenalkalicoccus suaedae TaxID=2592382 RepID=A0A859FAG0_9BACI|nr:response regulator [Paenalkalicoccus suaedae]QKS70293.1 response regulator [Paenalkalicoccus suaedae]